jgi:hypothetical protein
MSILDELEDEIKKAKSSPKKKRTPKKQSESKEEINNSDSNPTSCPILSDIDEEIESLISSEINRFSTQLNEQFIVLESINPLLIIDIEDRLKASKLKIELLQKLPTIMGQLNDLKEKEKLKSQDIRGSRELSPLETDNLEDFNEEDFSKLD